MNKYNKIKLSFLFSLFFILASILYVYTTSNITHAVTASDWRAGKIIDDVLFYDNLAMSANDIQSFLDNKTPTCDTNGTLPASEYGRSDLTHAQYAASKGWPAPPYICLKDYYQVPRNDQVITNFGNNIRPSGFISAAQIIKNAADNYDISPKALLVLLQKESPGPLITDNWPLLSQYKNAMGYGCPDTAPCDPAYEGFYNQITNAARQFKLYKDNASSYRYKPSQINSILFNPTTGCGSSDVYVENYSTAGLYNYTPYQPNQAALNNLYGLGDGCSAYGNRNFWRIYNDWFQSTSAPSYSWQWAGQALYTDSSKSNSVDFYNTTLNPKTRYYAVVKAKNVGNTTWAKGDFRLGTNNPIDRCSILADSTWISCARISTLTEDSVAPGQTGTFEFWITTPGPNQSINEYFNPLREGVAWLNSVGMSYPIKTGGYSWQWAGQALYTDSSKSTAIDSNSQLLNRNARYYAVVRAKNNGSSVWDKSDFRLGSSNQSGRSSAIYDSAWLSYGRPVGLTEDSVAPGQTGTFEFWITTPGPNQNTKEYFNLLREGVAWLNDVGMHFVIRTL